MLIKLSSEHVAKTYYKVRITHNLSISNDLYFSLEISEFNHNEDRRIVPLNKINLTKNFFSKKNLIKKKKIILKIEIKISHFKNLL
jgi:hypothetical protein